MKKLLGILALVLPGGFIIGLSIVLGRWLYKKYGNAFRIRARGMVDMLRG